MAIFKKYKSILAIGRLLVLSILLLLVSCTKSYTVQPIDTFNIFDAMSKSQLTFFGKVKDVKYRLSKESLPHTFVTYGISKVLYGSIEKGDQPHITLRFLGGPKGDGSFLLPSMVPHFNVDNEDVLLVSKNGGSECPLVGCKAGRLRIYNNRVYTDAGQPVIGFEKGRVVSEGKMEPALRVFRYPRPDFESMYQRKDYQGFLEKRGIDIDPNSLREMYEKNIPEELSFRLVQHSGKGEDSSKTGDPRINLPVRKVPDVEKKQLDLSELLKTLSSNLITENNWHTPVSNQDPSKAFNATIPGTVEPN